MALSRYERETVINYNEEESVANIFTASATMANKLKKIGELKTVDGGWEVEVPKAWVTIRPPKKMKPLTAEAKKKRLANLQK